MPRPQGRVLLGSSCWFAVNADVGVFLVVCNRDPFSFWITMCNEDVPESYILNASHVQSSFSENESREMRKGR